MAVAISGNFEALVGFRPMEDIVQFIERIPVFAEEVLGLGKELSEMVISASAKEDRKGTYKSMLERIMGLSAEALKRSLDGLMKFFTTQRDMLPHKEVFFKLSREFPGDVGILFAFLLNHIVLKEGDCIFLGANEPHAYLSGSCIELMTCSDNVVRAGLTPKFKDVPTLVEMLTYEGTSPQRFYVRKCVSDSPCTILYRPPIDDFALEEISVSSSESSHTFDSESLLLVTEGQGMLLTAENEKYALSAGSSLYLFPETHFSLKNGEPSRPLKVFRAFKPK
ncbi:mannose-6-phosphate isomerase [Mitosporidium daphniae]|uniref:Mannose-6-phosphate isomerase n=1 Tax=Mitosporidium daphniae TaxID=1485682 RepID=A0A098VVA5_9MICR|nr:mannose-6-phosphate isomerase [Mitosporidium daphniae]KGG51666.1 mannose-6-phosphate isomerase [Mitosporidium daphniae]|eukprot:XP_013238093.1 mannose-6-phosphate isomerase [Mitosporidium daphniae]